jgi:seryl-tRNA synthetase
MLDIKFIRDNKDIVQAGAAKKHIDFNVDELLALDAKRRELTLVVETKKTTQNSFSDKIPQTQDATERTKMIEEMKVLKAEMQKDEEALQEVMKEWQTLMLKVPNVPDMSVPDGDSDAENQEVKVWGDKPNFDFPAKKHYELMEKLDMVDLERGVKVAGFRGYILKNDGMLLQMALLNYATEFFSGRGFTPMIVPSMVTREPLMGTGYIPQSEDDLYKTQDALYLAGTGEVATMSYYADETLTQEQLPSKMLAFSPCFRREIGSHGKDVKGLYRVHEFYKLEQVVLCEASHETSVKLHEELTKNATDFLESLNIPYHVVVNCGGDLGLGQVKKYDIEAWRPGEGKYGETHSSSYFHDFQTRRLNIRYRDAEGKMRFAHSLNNTAIAFPRILIPFVENHQQADGTIKIPEVLQKYLGGRQAIS